ncbi:MAG: hypothetical protein JF888_04685 [Candidatus Dormibacteraeota bacterium]|uniref:Uncharacterized protein n=1 Tax=Candidatus Dormiibacter inghamiae TaxID=3127013 RepID=A0A934NCV3_9BACT|nr:hypothetical protein [Candidatus Dormibacteraeota bacterium]MBJ7605086.1 hypothetical protein [Candidatus Dormibacteraeota bacterium]
MQSRGEALDQSLPQLAAVLSAALPGAVQVEREGGLLRHSDRIKQLSVDTGEFRFLLQRQGSALQAVVSHEVGGIVLKSEKLPAAEWLIQLGERLRQIAVNAEQINPALARLLGADGQR